VNAYTDPAGFRQALEQRLNTRAAETSVEINRLRRRVVFECLLGRLETAAPGEWVLKGGMALEVRLSERARATRDLDLAIRDGDVVMPMRERLVEALLVDPLGDRFTFQITGAEALAADEAGRPGQRFSLLVNLAGREFARVRLDVVLRSEEMAGTERIRLPGLLAFAGLPAVEIEVVDRAQHFAEKLHALTRTYGDRPNTRVKDLVDLVVLIEDGLLPDVRLRENVEHVFRVRATHELPIEIPDPPAEWAPIFAQQADDVGLGTPDVPDALRVLRAFWADTLAAHG
jgi:predicted nucleotidyltransferase component of viral defense system